MSRRVWRALHGLTLAGALAMAWAVWSWESPGFWRHVTLVILVLTAVATLSNLSLHPRPPRQLDAGADGLWISHPAESRRAYLPWSMIESVRAEAVAGIPCVLIDLAQNPEPALRVQLGIEDQGGRTLMLPGQFKTLQSLRGTAKRLDQWRSSALRPDGPDPQPPNKP